MHCQPLRRSPWRVLAAGAALLVLSVTVACAEPAQGSNVEPDTTNAGAVRRDDDPVIAEIDAIVAAFQAQLLPVASRRESGLDKTRLDAALVELRSCLVDQYDLIAGNTGLDPDEARLPGDVLARLLRRRDEEVQTCITYRIAPHRVGIDPTPLVVRAFRSVQVDALNAAERALADPADLGPLAIRVSSDEGAYLVGGSLHYCLALPQPGAYTVTWKGPDGSTAREQAAYYRAVDLAQPWEQGGVCDGAVVTAAVTPDIPSRVCPRVDFAGRDGSRASAETCIEVTGYAPPNILPPLPE